MHLIWYRLPQEPPSADIRKLQMLQHYILKIVAY
jgi:hypothetical protein